MLSNPEFLADLVTLTGEILNGKLHFLCSVLIDSKKKISRTTPSNFYIWLELKQHESLFSPVCTQEILENCSGSLVIDALPALIFN